MGKWKLKLCRNCVTSAQKWRQELAHHAEDEEVLAAHERDLDVAPPTEAPLEVPRHGDATESPTEHDNAQDLVSFTSDVPSTQIRIGCDHPSLIDATT